MSIDLSSSGRETSQEPTRKAYHAPVLTDHGAVFEVTRGSSGTNNDASGPIFTGAGGLLMPVEGDFSD